MKPSGAGPGRDHGDAFYKTVADVYVEALDARWKRSPRSKVPSPSAAVAQTWGVNSSTANRWVKEARRRGLLNRYIQARCTGRCPVCCPQSAPVVVSVSEPDYEQESDRP